MKKLESIFGDVVSNVELRRYYLQHFASAISAAGNARFSMSYFFLYGGITVADVILTMTVWAVFALSALYPVAWLVNRIGVRKTHALHVIPNLVTLAIVLTMIFRIQNAEPVGFLFFVWMAVHGWKVMLKRLPLTAYFSHYGSTETRGRDVALAQGLTNIAAILSPLLFGTLIDQGHIVYFVLIAAAFSFTTSFCFGFKKDKDIKIDLHWKEILPVMPKRIKKALFFPQLVLPFMDDLFFIWILLLFDKNFALVGGLYAVKLALDMVLSWGVGQITDKSNIRPFYILAITLTTLFWFTVPFITKETSIYGVEAMWIYAALQFSVGLATLVWDGPYDSWYHNAAKRSREPFAFAISREVVIQMGMVLGGVLGLTLIQFTNNWHWFIMLGAPATLARLWMMPKKSS